jgi:nucleoside-diphosphate-sugar epimerase
MTILLTGAAGFLGTHLTKRFLSQGHKVIGVDNFITSHRSNLTEALKHPNFSFIEHDISQPIYFGDTIDWVLHFASPSSPIDYGQNQIKTIKVGTLGTYVSLGIAKKNNAKFFLASTSEVYGDPLVHPQTEDYWGNVNPNGARSCYDEAKRAAEAIAFAYHREHGIDIRVIRIFNTYGPVMRWNDGRVVSTFICQALKNEEITMFGDGLQTRSFCYVDDLVNGIVGYMGIKTPFAGPVNLGNPTEFTLLELAEKVIKLTGSKSKIVHKPLPPDDPKRRQPVIDLAKSLFAWEPAISLDEGLVKTIPWFAKTVQGGYEL